MSVPQARSFKVYLCARCPNFHVSLLDEGGKPFAEVVLSLAQLDNIRAYGSGDGMEKH